MNNLQYGQFPGINKKENVNHCKRCALDVLVHVLPSLIPEYSVKMQFTSVLQFVYDSLASSIPSQRELC